MGREGSESLFGRLTRTRGACGGPGQAAGRDGEHARGSVATIKRSLKPRRERGDKKPKAIPGRPEKRVEAALDRAGQPTASPSRCQTGRPLSRVGTDKRRMRVSTTTMSRAIKRIGWTRKKPAEWQSSLEACSFTGAAPGYFKLTSRQDCHPVEARREAMKRSRSSPSVIRRRSRPIEQECRPCQRRLREAMTLSKRT